MLPKTASAAAVGGSGFEAVFTVAPFICIISTVMPTPKAALFVEMVMLVEVPVPLQVCVPAVKAVTGEKTFVTCAKEVAVSVNENKKKQISLTFVFPFNLNRNGRNFAIGINKLAL